MRAKVASIVESFRPSVDFYVLRAPAKIPDTIKALSARISSYSLRLVHALGKVYDRLLNEEAKIINFFDDRVLIHKIPYGWKDIYPALLFMAATSFFSYTPILEVCITRFFLSWLEKGHVLFSGEPKEMNLPNEHPFLLIILGPILEEINSRGILQPFLAKLTGSSILSILGSSSHFAYGHSGVLRSIQAFIGGIYLGYLNEKHGLLTAFQFHGYYNMLCVLEDMFDKKMLDLRNQEMVAVYYV